MLDDRRVRRSEADDGERDTTAFEAIQDPVFSRHGREDQELDKAPADTIECEHRSNASRSKAETAAKFEGQRGVVGCGVLAGVVHEDWEELVVSRGVEGEECICN